MLCHEYGWTIDQVFDCTKDQINDLSKSIQKRMESSRQFEATIHGAELKKTRENTVDAGKDFDKLKGIGISIVEE